MHNYVLNPAGILPGAVGIDGGLQRQLFSRADAYLQNAQGKGRQGSNGQLMGWNRGIG